MVPYAGHTARTKCAVCCGLRCAAVTGGATLLLITVPCNALLLSGRICDGNGWHGFLNRNLLFALPVAAITFTHQTLLPEGLWSKNRKTAWDVNLWSTLSNAALWVVGVVVCTTASRRRLPSRSRTYRLLLWDWSRRRQVLGDDRL